MKDVSAFFYVVLTALFKSTVDGTYISFPATSTSTDVEVAEFHHLAVDPVSGTVFVGARNRLHQLDADLRPTRTVMTGPRLDNRLCTESFGAARCGAGGTTVYDARPTDNINKVTAHGHWVLGVRLIVWSEGADGRRGWSASGDVRQRVPRNVPAASRGRHVGLAPRSMTLDDLVWRTAAI